MTTNDKTEKHFEPVFIGNRWTLEVIRLEGGKIAGYVTAHTAQTVAINDPAYPSAKGFKVPKTVMNKLKVLMRKEGWVEDIYAYLKPTYMQELAAKGDGRRLPAEYANTSMARLYFPGDVNHDMYVQHYEIQAHAYTLWLALPKGRLCAFRGSGETQKVYHHDLVDAG